MYCQTYLLAFMIRAMEMIGIIKLWFFSTIFFQKWVKKEVIIKLEPPKMCSDLFFGGNFEDPGEVEENLTDILMNFS